MQMWKMAMEKVNIKTQSVMKGAIFNIEIWCGMNTQRPSFPFWSFELYVDKCGEVVKCGDDYCVVVASSKIIEGGVVAIVEIMFFMDQ